MWFHSVLSKNVIDFTKTSTNLLLEKFLFTTIHYSAILIKSLFFDSITALQSRFNALSHTIIHTYCISNNPINMITYANAKTYCYAGNLYKALIKSKKKPS